MKFLVFTFMLIAAAVATEIYSAEEVEKLRTFSSECIQSTHVDPEKVKQMREKHFDDDDQHLKDYVFCVFKKLHWIGDAGHVQKDGLHKRFDKQPVAKEALDACVDKQGSDGPDTAYTVFKCFLEHLPADVKGTL